jgi:Tol biopolymer transport system component
VRENAGLGHNDPDWSPDGKRIAFTYNSRDGSIGAPRIAIYTPATEAQVPDGARLRSHRGRRTAPAGRGQDDRHGRDIVIVRASDGAVLRRVTSDRRSFAPTRVPTARASPI